MTTVTQPLREEHKELLPHVEQLRVAADAVGDASFDDLSKRLNEAHRFLAHHLIPHATAEDEALYPVIAKVMGAPQATATMSRDHVEVGKLTRELKESRAKLEAAAKLSIMQAKELRRVLYGLYALVKVHFAKEEEVYLPLLDERLTQEEADDLFLTMKRAAGHAKHGRVEHLTA